MADTTTFPEAKQRPMVSDEDVTHVVCCCNDQLGLCGAGATGAWDEARELPCPLCSTIEDEPCPHCGCTCCVWVEVSEDVR